MHALWIAHEIAIPGSSTGSELAQGFVCHHEACEGVLREGTTRIELERAFQRVYGSSRVAQGVHAKAPQLECGQCRTPIFRVGGDELCKEPGGFAQLPGTAQHIGLVE